MRGVVVGAPARRLGVTVETVLQVHRRPAFQPRGEARLQTVLVVFQARRQPAHEVVLRVIRPRPRVAKTQVRVRRPRKRRAALRAHDAAAPRHHGCHAVLCAGRPAVRVARARVERPPAERRERVAHAPGVRVVVGRGDCAAGCEAGQRIRRRHVVGGGEPVAELHLPPVRRPPRKPRVHLVTATRALPQEARIRSAAGHDDVFQVRVVRARLAMFVAGGDRRAHPRRRVKSRAQFPQVRVRVRAPEKRLGPAHLLLEGAAPLLLEASFCEYHRVRQTRAAQPELLRQRVRVQLRVQRDGRREEEGNGGIPYLQVLVAETGLARPFALHGGGERKVRPRSGQRRCAEQVRLAVEQDLVRKPLLAERAAAGSGHRVHLEARVALHPRIEMASRAEEPVGQLALQPQRVLPLPVARLLAHQHEGRRRGGAAERAAGRRLFLPRAEVVELHAGAVLNARAAPVVLKVELQDVCLLVDKAQCRVDVLHHAALRGVAPVQRGLRAVAELKFVAQRHARPVGQSQSHIERSASAVHEQLAAQPETRRGERRVSAAGVVVVAPPLLKLRAHETHVAPVEREFHGVVLVAGQCATGQREARVHIELLLVGEVRRAPRDAGPQPRVLAELRLVAADGDEANRGRDGELNLRLAAGRGGVPLHALVNPRAEFADLLGGERFPLARRGHLLLRVHPRDQVDEPALRAAPRQDDHAVLTAAQRGGAAVEAEAALGIHRAVAAQASAFEDGLDVAREVNRGGGGGRELAGVERTATQHGGEPATKHEASADVGVRAPKARQLTADR